MRLEHQEAGESPHPVNVSNSLFYRQSHFKKASLSAADKASASACFARALNCHAWLGHGVRDSFRSPVR